MGQQPWRHRCRRLPLFGSPLANLLAIKNTALKIDKGSTCLSVRGGAGNRARPRAGVEPDQDKTCDVAQGALRRKNWSAFPLTRMDRLLFPVPPAMPYESGGLVPRQPPVTCLAL